MNILVLGAGGFVGRGLVAELANAGHTICAITRRFDPALEAMPNVRSIAIDLSKAIEPADWERALQGIEVIVNCAGVLNGKQSNLIHCEMPKALHSAAKNAGVRRVVLISAISARDDVDTDYARTKLTGEDLLRQSGLEWVIMRPSLIYAEGSYGGTSLLRALAAMPIAIALAGNGNFAFSPIHRDCLSRAVLRACEEGALEAVAVEPVGPDTFTLKQLLVRYRAWLGFPPARFLRIPMWAMHALGTVGDWLGLGPVSRTSLIQMTAGNEGRYDAYQRILPVPARSLDDAMANHPAGEQDRWHARLFLLKPAITGILALMWLVSGLLAFAGDEIASEFFTQLGGGHAAITPIMWISAAWDIGIAALLLSGRKPRMATILQLTTIIAYTVIFTAVLPTLWLDPLGPILKNVPILALVLVHAALRGQR